MKKSETEKKTEALDNNILVGYVRRSNAGGALKLSINLNELDKWSKSRGLVVSSLVLSEKSACNCEIRVRKNRGNV